MVLPLFVLPFITMLFWSMGGGRPAVAAPETPGGLNTSLPEPQLEGRNPVDKLSLYQQAEKDSLRREEALRSDGFFFEDRKKADTIKKSDGSTASSYRGAEEDPNEARVNRKLEELQKELEKSSDSSTARRQTITGPVDPEAGEDYRKLQEMLQSMSPGNTNVGADPEMAQLNSMLDKIMDIQDPSRKRDRLKSQSEKQRTKVFPVELADQDNITGTMQPQGQVADASDSISVKSSRTAFTVKRFFELESSGQPQEPATAIPAVIHETQVLVSGATVRIRLEQDVYIQGRLIPRGTFVYGKCGLSGDRLLIPVTDIRFGNAILPVNLSVYSLDGLEGIHVQGSITGDVTKETANETLQSLQLAALDPSISQQAAAAGIETVKELVSRKTRLVKVTVKAGHPVLLVNSDN